MSNRGVILLVTGNSELHQVLGTVAQTYRLSLLSAESTKEGLTFLKVAEPDCAIFDLGLLRTGNGVEKLKERLNLSAIPILFLNNCRDGSKPSRRLSSGFSLEPIVKFASEQSERLNCASSRGFLRRFVGRLKLGTA
jgi:response regulator RpfG family c-di-GMP phosphodiesterase